MILSLLWIGVCLLFLVAILEIFYPRVLHEGFEAITSIGDTAFWASHVPRRGDIGYDASEEEGGYIRDGRYFAGYADVQRLGVNQDFCRMVTSKGDSTDTFFACALGGTEGLSSVRYRTPSTRQGFELSRDDYMSDIGYCRILKVDPNTFEARCNPSKDESFGTRTLVDANPPADTEELLLFYSGVVFWLRFVDDMVDYAKNLVITTTGNLTIDEAPPLRLADKPEARTLEFNGIDQYMRIGDGKELEFGGAVDLRYLRAVSLWVYFEDFTNNAHIFDFGNGAGKDNVFLGILGRGSEGISQKVRDPSCGDSTVPPPPSGAQPCDVVTPQRLMETTPANVNEYVCEKPDIYGRIMPPIQPKSSPPHDARKADLVYEIWDHQQRKLHVQLHDAVPIRKWTHVVITTTSQNAAKPDLNFYVNGALFHEEKGAWLPQETYTTHNYIGKSNWTNATSPFQNADALFKGKLFDLRGYQTQMSPKKVEKTYRWGKALLGV